MGAQAEEKTRLAVVGCGNVSRMHLAGYLAHQDSVAIVAVCDPVDDHAEEAARTVGLERWYTSVDRMLDAEEWDITVVCTPTPVRAEIVSRVAAAGRHLFVEKPLATDLATATDMVEMCEAAGVQLAVHQNFRYFYPFEMARLAIAAGDIGDVISFTHRDIGFRQDKGWRVSEDRHALSVMGVHWLDGIRRVLGGLPGTLSCETRSSKLVAAKGDTDAAVMMRYPGGLGVLYQQSFSSFVEAVETVIVGDEGTLGLTYGDMRRWTGRADGEIEAERSPNPYDRRKPEATFRALQELIVALEEGKPPSNSGRDNLQTIAMLDAAYRSASTGRAVELGPGRPAPARV